jgi:hypothetical protein
MMIKLLISALGLHGMTQDRMARLIDILSLETLSLTLAYSDALSHKLALLYPVVHLFHLCIDLLLLACTAIAFLISLFSGNIDCIENLLIALNNEFANILLDIVNFFMSIISLLTRTACSIFTSQYAPTFVETTDSPITETKNARHHSSYFFATPKTNDSAEPHSDYAETIDHKIHHATMRLSLI